MGEVKDAVKGPKKIVPKIHEDNLVTRVTDMLDEVGTLVEKKDEDALKEGPDKKAENTRKAAQLRAVAGLLRSAKNILEDY